MTMPAIQTWNPSVDEEQSFRATDETLEWLCNLSPKLLRELGGKWVAAKECQIVASADSLDALLEQFGDVDLSTMIIDRVERPAWVVYR